MNNQYKASWIIIIGITNILFFIFSTDQSSSHGNSSENPRNLRPDVFAISIFFTLMETMKQVGWDCYFFRNCVSDSHFTYPPTSPPFPSSPTLFSITFPSPWPLFPSHLPLSISFLSQSPSQPSYFTLLGHHLLLFHPLPLFFHLPLLHLSQHDECKIRLMYERLLCICPTYKSDILTYILKPDSKGVLHQLPLRPTVAELQWVREITYQNLTK